MAGMQQDKEVETEGGGEGNSNFVVTPGLNPRTQQEQEREQEQPLPRSSPAAPHPSATQAQVRAFLAAFLLFRGHASTQDRAQELARRCYLSGECLYTLPEVQWQIDYGEDAGGDVYGYLRGSRYGFLRRAGDGPWSDLFCRAWLMYLDSSSSSSASASSSSEKKEERLDSQASRPSAPSVSVLQQECIKTKPYPGGSEELSSGSTSQNDLKSGIQPSYDNCGQQEDSAKTSTVRPRRLYSKDVDG